MTDLVVRQARDEDQEEILDVLRLALGETPLLKRTPELWQWKHRHNPFGESLVLLAESEGRIAGVRALMRWRLITPANETLECLRPVDTATHPDFARRGVFRRLTMTAIDLARSDGIDLIFNTPNERSRPGYIKMGWRDVDVIGVMVRPLARSAVRPAADGLPELNEAAPGLRPFEETPSHVPDRPALGLRTVREPAYVKWRFAQHPAARYGWIEDDTGSRLVARVGVRNSRTELVVSDLMNVSDSRVVRLAANQARTRYMAGWFSKTAPERKSAILGGMIPVPGVKALRLVAYPLREIDMDVFDLASWDIGTSDLELL